MYKPPENKYGWKPDSERGNRHERGYGTHWNKLRQYVLAMNMGMCAECLRHSRYTAATQVDHIIPKAKGGEDLIDNLQPLCDDCHNAKTARDKGYKVKQGNDLDGMPNDPEHHWGDG